DFYCRNCLYHRPHASPGGWLCLLLPLALLTSYLQAHKTTPPACAAAHDAVHLLLLVSALGMCLRTLCFLFNSSLQPAALSAHVINLLPGIVSSVGYTLLCELKWQAAAICGFLVPALYQCVYMRVMRGLPQTFTLGEASILVQGLLLFVLNALARICMLSTKLETPATDYEQLNAIMQSALLCLLLLCLLLVWLPALRQPLPFYLLLALLGVAVTCAPVTTPLPLWALLAFLCADHKRLLLLAFYLLLVALTAATVRWQLSNCRRASTRVRKIFHLLIVLVFVPGVLYECALLYMGTGIALAVFVVVELLRLLQLPPLGATLLQAFDAFRDVKDAGQLALTPFCLLIGCALPLWLTVCPCECTANPRQLALLAGVLAVGVGDTAASVVGSTLGRHKWNNSTRSLEGTAAFVASVLLSVWLLQLCCLLTLTPAQWFVTLFAALNSALVEAFTDQVDNLVLPLVFYILVGLA
ncbi:hypothetical protein KR222_000845, partial [Zaprionus bogoriensis]